MSRLGRPDGESAYLRLTTRPLDQALCRLPEDEQGRAARRRDVLAGAYLLQAVPTPEVTLVAVGALVPSAVEAADTLAGLGVQAEVVVVTSYDRVWRAVQQRAGRLVGPAHGVDEGVLDRAFGSGAPMVTLLDGHPHTLAFLATIARVPVTCLGVSAFGQGGGMQEVHQLHGLDAGAVVEAALDLLDR